MSAFGLMESLYLVIYVCNLILSQEGLDFPFYLLNFFTEQQEQLKLILQNFKEDIHHHLLDCNSILEGMEAHQIELKGIMKKQSM